MNQSRGNSQETNPTLGEALGHGKIRATFKDCDYLSLLFFGIRITNIPVDQMTKEVIHRSQLSVGYLPSSLRS